MHYHSREDVCHVWVIKRSFTCLEIGMEPKSRVTLMSLIMNLFHAYHGGKTQKVQCALWTARSLCNIPLGKKNQIFPNALLGANKKVHRAWHNSQNFMLFHKVWSNYFVERVSSWDHSLNDWESQFEILQQPVRNFQSRMDSWVPLIFESQGNFSMSCKIGFFSTLHVCFQFEVFTANTHKQKASNMWKSTKTIPDHVV